MMMLRVVVHGRRAGWSPAPLRSRARVISCIGLRPFRAATATSWSRGSPPPERFARPGYTKSTSRRRPGGTADASGGWIGLDRPADPVFGPDRLAGSPDFARAVELG